MRYADFDKSIADRAAKLGLGISVVTTNTGDYWCLTSDGTVVEATDDWSFVVEHVEELEQYAKPGL